MRALLQRVSQAQVRIDGQSIASIGRGWVVFLGVGHSDDDRVASELAEKTAHLRCFEDPDGKMNLSALEVGAQVLVVSQFTLYADTRKGRRPSFMGAAPPERAEPLVEKYVAALRELGLEVQTGRFRAFMEVEIHNEGPVTIGLEVE